MMGRIFKCMGYTGYDFCGSCLHKENEYVQHLLYECHALQGMQFLAMHRFRDLELLKEVSIIKICMVYFYQKRNRMDFLIRFINIKRYYNRLLGSGVR